MSGIRDDALRLMGRASELFPEGAQKNRLRAVLLGFRSSLPRELMAGRGQTVLQVGMWSRRNLLRGSRAVGAAGRVVLVEADPDVLGDLATFKAEQGLANVTLVNRGAFNRKDRKKFRVGTSPGFSRVDGTSTQMLSEVGRQAFAGHKEIDVDTVDNIVAELGVSRVDYAEITVNGLELEVLEGMERTLPVTERLLVSGYARVQAAGGPTNRRTAGFLRQRGFQTRISRRGRIRQDYFDEAAAREWGLLDGHVFAWRG